MRFLPLVGVTLLVACSSQPLPQVMLPQAGCTAENCQLMLQACRAEFSGMPAALGICTGFDKPPAPIDLSEYCVKACNAHSGSGQVASCIAAKAADCRTARDAGMDVFQLLDACADKTAKQATPACEEACAATRKTCDDGCSGGKPCDDCLRAGGTSCASVCSASGWKSCLDCSGNCGTQYIACADACPRVP